MIRTDPPALDVLLSGTVFLDIVFTDLPAVPAPGTEVWTGGMGSSPGGIANLAVAASRLGLRTGLAAGFGDDGYGRWCWQVLGDQEGVDLGLSRVFPGWHSPVTVSLAYDDDRAMITHGHPEPLGPRELIGTPPPTRAVITELDGDADAEPWWRPAQRAGSLVFADVGWDDTGTWDRAVLRQLDGCHCFMPNVVEAQAYTRTGTPEAALDALTELVPLAVVTGGSRGAWAHDATTGERVAVPSLRVPAIDPTGAGDVFGAALVTATLSGWPLEQRLRFAALCAALSVQQFAGALAAPGWGDIADWWSGVAEATASGDPVAAALAGDYAFLPEVIPPGPAGRVRRAEATIATFSDLPEAPPSSP